MSSGTERMQGRRGGDVDGRSVAAGLFFTFLTNLDYTVVAALLPIAVINGIQVSPLEFSLALSIRVFASLAGNIVEPLLFGRVHASRVVLVSAIVKAASFLPLLVTTHGPGLYTFALLTGLGVGMSKAALRALLSAAAGDRHQARVFQVLFLAMNAAFVVAPVIAQAVVSFGGERQSLIVLAVVELTGGLWVGIAARRARAEVVRTVAVRGAGRLTRWRRPGMIPLLSYTLVLYFAMGFLLAMFLLYERVMPPLAEYRTFLLSLQPLATVVIQLALMPVYAKLSRPHVYLTAAISAGVGMFLSFTSSVGLVIAGLVLFALCECLAVPQTQVDVSAILSPDQRRLGFAMTTIVGAVGQIIGSMAAGYLADTANAGPYAQVVAVLMLAGFTGGGLMIVRATRKHPG